MKQELTEQQEYEQYRENLDLLIFHEKKAEYYKRLTRQYAYKQENLRKRTRDEVSAEYYRNLEMKK